MKRLNKSGKFTDKFNRQIKWTFILLVCLIGVVAERGGLQSNNFRYAGNNIANDVVWWAGN